MNDELREKTERLVEMLALENLGGVVLNAQHNFAWLTGGSSNGIDLSRENGAASILVRADGKRFLLANRIESGRMLAEEVSGDEFEPVAYSWQDEKASGGSLIGQSRALLNVGDIATDIPIDPKIRIIDGSVAACRYSLTAPEIDRFRQLGIDAGRAMRSVVGKLSLGETEHAIAEKLRHELAAHGITSVVTLVAADERIAKFRHPVPTGNRWNKIVLLVTCAKRHGLIASLSRMICIGDVPDELKRKTEVAAYVNASLISATQPGTTGAQLYDIAAAAYAECGFAAEINNHHQGGAAGYRTRDWAAHPKSTETVKVNQAFAWNPSIAGTKVEETIIVMESGFETITTSPDFPIITTVVDGCEYLSPGILSL